MFSSKNKYANIALNRGIKNDLQQDYLRILPENNQYI